MNLEPVLIRTHILKLTRQFFDEQGFQEIITPVFSRSLPLEPNLYSFQSTWKTVQATQDLYLSVSPESSLKKMMALGISDCYAISKCFRNLEGSGAHHNPEFLMLEWYRKKSNYQEIMIDTQKLILFIKEQLAAYLKIPFSPLLNYQGEEINLASQWPKISLVSLFKEYSAIDMKQIQNEAELKKVAQKKGYNIENSSWEQLFDQIFLNEIEQHLPTTPFFLIDFPARLSPLCQVNQKMPYLAERFELYIAGMEIANGNNEQLDAHLVATHFNQESRLRLSQKQSHAPIDSDFLIALEKLKKVDLPVAGIGLGLDRLALLLSNTTKLSQVEPFTVNHQLFS